MLKIIDFGLSKMNAEAHEPGLMIGTVDYIAPEVFITKGDPRSYAPPCDIWAAGLICYQLIAGVNPLKRNN